MIITNQFCIGLKKALYVNTSILYLEKRYEFNHCYCLLIRLAQKSHFLVANMYLNIQDHIIQG